MPDPLISPPPRIGQALARLKAFELHYRPIQERRRDFKLLSRRYRRGPAVPVRAPRAGA